MPTAKTADFDNARFWTAATSHAAKIPGWLSVWSVGAIRTKPSLVVSSPLSSSHAGGAACAAQKTKSAARVSPPSSRTRSCITSTTRRPLTTLPAARIEGCQQYLRARMVYGQQMRPGMNNCELSFVSQLRMHCQRQFHSACAAAYDNNSHSCVRGCCLDTYPTAQQVGYGLRWNCPFDWRRLRRHA